MHTYTHTHIRTYIQRSLNRSVLYGWILLIIHELLNKNFSIKSGYLSMGYQPGEHRRPRKHTTTAGVLGHPPELVSKTLLLQMRLFTEHREPKLWLTSTPPPLASLHRAGR